VTTLDEWPQNVVAGKPVTVTFTVRQHGVRVMTEETPVFFFHNKTDRKSLRVQGQLQPHLKRFMATMTFPSAGEWTWEMTSFPPQRFPNLIVHKTRPTVPALLDGKTVFLAKGCYLCHAHQAVAESGMFANAYGVNGAPSLSPNKWDAAYLRAWLKNPKAVKPATQMPNFGLRDKDIEVLVTFITVQPKP
jgi:cytochrome c2